MRFSTGIKTLKILAALVATLVLAVIATVQTINLDRYRGLVAAEVGQASGRPLTIKGSLRLSFSLSLTPSLVMKNVTFGNAPWGSRPHMVTVRKMTAAIGLGPLLSGKLQVRRLVLFEPDILFETDGKGRANWALTPPPPDAARAVTPPLAVAEVVIEGARITWRDGATRKTATTVIDRISATLDGMNKPILIVASANYGGIASSAHGTIGAPEALFANRPYPIDITATAAGSNITLSGKIASPLSSDGVDLVLTAHGSDIGALLFVPDLGPFEATARLRGTGQTASVSALAFTAGRGDRVLVKLDGAIADVITATGVDLGVVITAADIAVLGRILAIDIPQLPSTNLVGHLSSTRNGLTLSNLSGTIGHSDLRGSISLQTAVAPFVVRAELTARVLDLDQMTSATKTTAVTTPLFSDTVLPLTLLKRLEGEVRLNVARLEAVGTTFSDVEMKAVLADGRLTLETLKGVLANGKASLTGSVEPANGVAVVRAMFDLDRVDLGRFLKDRHVTDGLKGGSLTLRAGLSGRGPSVREVMSGLSGDVVAVMGEARLDVADPTILAVLSESGPDATILCATARVSVRHGVAVIGHGLTVEGGKTNLIGGGSINFRTEHMDLALRPRSGTAPQSRSAPPRGLRLRGGLTSPKAETESARITNVARTETCAAVLASLPRKER